MSYPVLVLNLDNTPYDIWGWKKTMAKLMGSQSVMPI